MDQSPRLKPPNGISVDEQRWNHKAEKKRIAKLVAALFEFAGDEIVFEGKLAEILGELYSMWRVNHKALERLRKEDAKTERG